MIKIEELRVGSWVKFGTRDALIMNTTDLMYCENHPNSINPIPLTEDILLKCGFESGSWFLHVPKCNMYIIWFSKKNVVDLEIAEGTYSPHLDYECKHLHQLQNLYHALTGEELQIEL